MGIHKLHLDEFDEVDYELIAIHTSLEDFRLAYFINQQLPILLSRSNDEIGITTKDGEAAFTKFSYDDVAKDILWSLVQNKNEIITYKKNNTQDLFLDENVEIATKVYLLPELKKVDYFLKIENNCNTFEIEEILQKLNKIEWITTVYEVIPDNIKSKNNLIF